MNAARVLGVTIAALPLLLALAWVIGHRTARVVRVPVGATAAEDETALSAADEQLLGQWSAHLETLTAPFDPDTAKDHDV
ncbi:hypothetical protein [Streptomyces sp. AMCC400023]|uniref:hypothetical protein n=1 Tax=Streptomyces sp. AMCC400023 TaxID=2056258 RepID=UPI001F27E08B|nr:hypothetical protein [Streptomyces sp. AMCC400023]UJV43828.1 hypothetical protein CVT30_31935 [Streptomyces sp. AMCC400023]